MFINNPHFRTWIPDSRAFQPVPGRKFHVESEFEVKSGQILHNPRNGLIKKLEKENNRLKNKYLEFRFS